MYSFLSNDVHCMGKADKIRGNSWCQHICQKEVGHVQEDGGKLIKSEATPGANTYAKKKSAMFKRMEDNAAHFDRAGYHDLRVKLENGESLVTHIQAERNKAKFFIPEIQAE